MGYVPNPRQQIRNLKIFAHHLSPIYRKYKVRSSKFETNPILEPVKSVFNRHPTSSSIPQFNPPDPILL
jgi:hypothetical protein